MATIKCGSCSANPAGHSFAVCEGRDCPCACVYQIDGRLPKWLTVLGGDVMKGPNPRIYEAYIQDTWHQWRNSTFRAGFPYRSEYQRLTLSKFPRYRGVPVAKVGARLLSMVAA